MILPVRLILVLWLLVSVAGCGQSGPLYLPGNPSSVQAPPAETPAEEDEDEADERDES